MELTHSEIEELLGAFALDAVEPDERQIITDHLPTCPRCRGEVEAHLEVAGLLGNAGATAPAHGWDRIASALDGSAPPAAFPLDRARTTAPSRLRARQLAVRTGIAAAAAATVLLAGVAVTTIRDQQQEIDDLAQQMADSRIEQSAAEAMGEPDSQVVDLSGEGELALRAVIAGDGSGFLLEGLPPLANDRTYQLWGLTPGETVSLGVLGSDPGVVPFHVDDPTTGLAVTQERSGGVEQSRNEPLVSGTFA